MLTNYETTVAAAVCLALVKLKKINTHTVTSTLNSAKSICSEQSRVEHLTHRIEQNSAHMCSHSAALTVPFNCKLFPCPPSEFLNSTFLLNFNYTCKQTERQ